jgi:hypothetical protein
MKKYIRAIETTDERDRINDVKFSRGSSPLNAKSHTYSYVKMRESMEELDGLSGDVSLAGLEEMAGKEIFPRPLRDKRK